MKKTNNIIEIFKYGIYQTNLKTDLNLLKKFCIKSQNKKGRVKSNINGWQSEDLHEQYPILVKLKKQIFEHINIYAKEFKIDRELNISNLWININEYKDCNLPHIHTNSILSGVFYVQVFKNSGDLSFKNPCEDNMASVLDKNILEYNPYNSSNWYFKPENNMLLLFPSWLRHMVKPNMDKKQKRISISFNAN